MATNVSALIWPGLQTARHQMKNLEIRHDCYSRSALVHCSLVVCFPLWPRCTFFLGWKNIWDVRAFCGLELFSSLPPCLAYNVSLQKQFNNVCETFFFFSSSRIWLRFLEWNLEMNIGQWLVFIDPRKNASWSHTLRVISQFCYLCWSCTLFCEWVEELSWDFCVQSCLCSLVFTVWLV